MRQNGTVVLRKKAVALVRIELHKHVEKSGHTALRPLRASPHFSLKKDRRFLRIY